MRKIKYVARNVENRQIFLFLVKDEYIEELRPKNLKHYFITVTCDISYYFNISLFILEKQR